jgi:CheY-like chemotaxis protein
VEQPGPQPRKILLADDDLGLRRLVEATLAGDEYVILQAANGEEALTIAAREQPDAILLDIEMPGGMNGLEVCRRLKGDPATSRAVVIMLTGAHGEEQRQIALANGAADYITKPFSPLALLRRLEDLFDAAP